MAGQGSEHCPHRAAVEALAHDALADEQRRKEQRHLEQCAACRELFRQRTAGWYPALENYTIIEKVDEGGFGVVYKAIHHAKQRSEALKVLYGRTPLRAAYFENEVHLVARLRHPNIATLYEAQLKTPPLYYTMEFVEGERLDHYLKRHEVRLPERIRIIKTVAAAIGYAHGEGVAHRDLKPQNILIDAAGQPRIVDFGIAKKLALADQPAARPAEREGPVGTLGYIAPEQSAGRSADARADIFALGALLFHCVSGEPARWVKDARLLARVLHERGVARGAELAAIIRRAVAPDPARRYPSCAELVGDLENYLQGRAVRARDRRPLRARAGRLMAFELLHHPYAVRAALASCVAALLVGIFWRLNVRWYAPGAGQGRTVLVSFSRSTLEAVAAGRIGAGLAGLRVWNPKSWRLLHGRLMEKLAAARPLVVVWDYYFPDAWPEFDAAFVRGARALKAPVVVGCEEFDVNGQPQMSAAIRQAVSAVGALISQRPGWFSGEFELVGCFQRGFEKPIPALALAAFAAARFPDCDLDLRLEPASVQLRYRKRHPGPGQSRWRPQVQEIPVRSLRRVARPQAGLRPGDRCAHLRIRATRPELWHGPTIAYEEVLTAPPARLRAWFDGRAVVVGQTIPPADQYAMSDGGKIFGCQIHAQALDQLLAEGLSYAFTRAGLVLRVCLWCAAGLVLAGLRTPTPRRSLGKLTAGCLAAAGLGIGLAVYAAAWVTDARAVEAAIGLSSLLLAGSLALLAGAIRRRQLQLAPETFAAPAEGATLDSTVLAETT